MGFENSVIPIDLFTSSSIFLMAFSTSLEGQVTYSLSVFATSSFYQHSLVATVLVVQQVVNGMYYFYIVMQVSKNDTFLLHVLSSFGSCPNFILAVQSSFALIFSSHDFYSHYITMEIPRALLTPKSRHQTSNG